jgi:hypothetical protein
MAAVLEDVAEEARQQALETADYSISVGLTIGLERPGQARRLLELIEAEEPERDALNAVAAVFLEEVFACGAAVSSPPSIGQPASRMTSRPSRRAGRIGPPPGSSASGGAAERSRAHHQGSLGPDTIS